MIIEPQHGKVCLRGFPNRVLQPQKKVRGLKCDAAVYVATMPSRFSCKLSVQIFEQLYLPL